MAGGEVSGIRCGSPRGGAKRAAGTTTCPSGRYVAVSANTDHDGVGTLATHAARDVLIRPPFGLPSLRTGPGETGGGASATGGCLSGAPGSPRASRCRFPQGPGDPARVVALGSPACHVLPATNAAARSGPQSRSTSCLPRSAAVRGAAIRSGTSAVRRTGASTDAGTRSAAPLATSAVRPNAGKRNAGARWDEMHERRPAWVSGGLQEARTASPPERPRTVPARTASLPPSAARRADGAARRRPLRAWSGREACP